MEFSKIQLGTVQFGINYGIANTAGKVSYETARDIISVAVTEGVNTLDTAAAYGNSEEVLGRALTELQLQEDVRVISKIPPIKADNLSSNEIEDFITKTVETSLRRLRRDHLDVCLFHNENDIKYIDILEKLETKGLIKGSGVSLNSTAYCEAVVSREIRFVQLAYNILDKRYNDFLEIAQSNNIKIFARSLYLQGLLVMPENNIKPFLKDVIPVRRKLEELAESMNIGMPELCARFVAGNHAITSILIGVDNLEQLKENISIIRKGPLPNDILSRIDEIVPILSEEIIMPTNWQKYINSKNDS